LIYDAVHFQLIKTAENRSSPGSSTSSEIPQEEQDAMGMTPGLVRFSMGLDNDPSVSLERIKECMRKVGLLK
jgi:methionine-gamma-lyase